MQAARRFLCSEMLSERARAWAAENELAALAEKTMDTQWTVVVSLGLRKPIESLRSGLGGAGEGRGGEAGKVDVGWLVCRGLVRGKCRRRLHGHARCHPAPLPRKLLTLSTCAHLQRVKFVTSALQNSPSILSKHRNVSGKLAVTKATQGTVQL